MLRLCVNGLFNQNHIESKMNVNSGVRCVGNFPVEEFKILRTLPRSHSSIESERISAMKRLLAALVAIFCLAAHAEQSGEKRALLVGVQEYAGSGLGNLKYC